MHVVRRDGIFEFGPKDDTQKWKTARAMFKRDGIPVTDYINGTVVGPLFDAKPAVVTHDETLDPDDT